MLAEQKPTHVRHGVVAFVSILAGILYLDRVCISKAAPLIAAEFDLTDTQMGYVFAAFTFAYAIFEIPAGWMGDRLGPRRVLTRIVLWWSLFTALTGQARGFLSLLVMRFLFGAGEAGCFPNTAKAYSIWLPPDERNRAQSFLWICARWAGAFTPYIVYQILQLPFMTWRRTFLAFGGLGFLWSGIFYVWFRDHPREHPGVNEAERQLLEVNARHSERHGDVPWKRFLAAPTTWLLWVQYFCFSWTWYFYISWLPRFLDDRFPGQMSPGMRSLFTGVPLFLGGLGSFTCGFIARWAASSWGGPSRSRKLLAGGGFALAAGALLVTLPLHHMGLVLTLLGVSCFLADFVIPVSWAACIDVGGKFSGTYSGSMNMMGNLGGAAATATIGHLLDLTHRNWDLVFYLSAGVFVVGAACWTFIDPVTPMDDAAPLPQAA
ncbi:MAG TPA: MFS transporter [Planctomycetota bacterium]|nr:MFS transporter [Planctomycetota bacterium]